jgi:threonine synthase
VPRSFMTHLECPKCHREYDAGVVQHLCECGSPLLVRYDLDAAARHVTPADIGRRAPSLWRYRELLPVQDDANEVSLGEGMTPILPIPRVGAAHDLPRLCLKDEGLLPTGTFKARGAAVGVSRAKELGVGTLALPTNGNAGGAWAIYAARAGIKAVVVMPQLAPEITRKECTIAGADLYLIDGLITDAGRLVGQAVPDTGWYDVSTLKEPYRIEGKKTMGYEIAEQFDWSVPDVILYPTGGGVGLIGIYKALEELRTLGWIGPKLPRLVSVQASGCAPIVKAWRERRVQSDPWPDAQTIAFGINVPKALGDFLVLEALYGTDGCAVEVSDDKILEAQRELGREEGLFVCPEGAATLAAAVQLRQEGWIHPEEQVLLLNTGTGLKYPETVSAQAPLVSKDGALPTGR